MMSISNMCFGGGQLKGLIQKTFKGSILEFDKLHFYVLEINCFPK